MIINRENITYYVYNNFKVRLGGWMYDTRIGSLKHKYLSCICSVYVSVMISLFYSEFLQLEGKGRLYIIRYALSYNENHYMVFSLEGEL